MGIGAEKTGAGITRAWTKGLGAFLAAVGQDKLVLLGVGNPIKSDDSVGLFIADSLHEAIGDGPRLSILSADAYPELALSRVDLRSSHLLIFDAMEAGARPGAIVLAGIGDTEYGFFATHNLPLKLHPSIVNRYERVSILGVQPGNLEVGEALSPVVKDAAERVVGEVERQLTGSGGFLG